MELKRIGQILKDHEKRISLLESKKSKKDGGEKKSWYRSGSTVDKIITLIKEGFFNKPKSIKDIVGNFVEKDFHLKAPDLTLPLRKIVRNGLLQRTKRLPDGSIAKKWHYIKSS